MPALFARGFAHQIDERGVLQEAPPRHVFKHPSKRQSKYFFVASDLLWDEVDAYFIAVLICSMAWSRVKVSNVMHIDTMGIYPIARAVADVARASGGLSIPWQIHNFHSHGGMGGLYRVVQPNELVLISASTSGAMAATLVSEGVPAEAVLTLLDLTDKQRSGTIVHARSRHMDADTPSARAMDDDTVIELHGEYFSARGKRPRALTLSRDHRPPQLELFLAELAGQACLRLNGARAGQQAVDVVSVDEAAVAASDTFRSWLSDEVRLKTPASVSHVLHAPGEGGKRMAGFCAELLTSFRGKAPAVQSIEDLFTTLDTGVVTGVLVCAPVLGNGHAMRSVARDLRELVPDASRHFVAGVGLPQTAAAWARLTQFLTQSGKPGRPYLFSSWAVVPTGALPGRGTAWQRASHLQQSLDRVATVTSSYWTTTDILESVELVSEAVEQADQAFLAAVEGSNLSLTRGFVFWDPKPEVLASSNQAASSYLAMTSALQMAREHPDSKLRLSSSVHEVVLMDPETFLRYNDGILQASILRATLPHELDYSGAPDLSELMREFLEKVFVNHERSYGEAAPEFALALATGHLRLTDKDRRVLFDRISASVKKASVLLGLLHYYAAN